VLLGEAGGRRRAAVVAAALVVFVCALAVPAVAGAEELKVDSTADETDANLLDPACLTAAGKCSLRAAIEEANESGEGEIVFDEAIFDGGIAGTIVLGSGLPPIAASFVRIEGECEREGVFGPCVGLEGPPTGPALTVNHAFGVEIAGLAFGGAETGISVIEEAEQARVTGSWFGLKLDGSSAPGVNGVSVGPGSAAAHIGGEAASAGNVFASLSGTALTLAGASKVKILGNYFGVKPDGVTPAANGEDVEIVSEPGFEAVGNSIGTEVSAEAAATPKCDRGCNLISGSTSNGVDLQGDGGSEGPARNTAIAGNYFGLDANGSAAVPNAAASIRVGEAAQTVIGGRKVGEANRINGGATGILSGPGAPDLIVRGNAVGVDATGTGTLAPPVEAFSIDSEGVASAATEALIADNAIAMQGGIAISLHDQGASVLGNSISGAEVGIRTDGSSEPLASLIEGNEIRDSGANGLLIENNNNEVLGNEIVDSGGAGVKISGAVPFGNLGNLIGGDAVADENLISGSGGAAIEIAEPATASNEVARNHGAGNDGLFVDLVQVLPEGVLKYRTEAPPTSLAATPTALSGKAEPGSQVRVFRKAGPAAGELESFLGEAVADAKGAWTVVYGAPVPGGTIVAATQTGEIRGTSELATAMVPAEPGGGLGGGSGGGGTGGGSAPKAAADTLAPATTVLKGPRGKSSKTTARFEFDADESGASFQCKLDQKPFKPCESPRTYKHLKPGKHVFKVRAVDPAGNVGAPAKRKFTVLG
jgi:CSLREA domain-containing protein